MKSTDIAKIMAHELGTSNIDELNKVLKDKKTSPVKFRIAGKSLGHSGFSGFIKNITPEGLKVFDINKVSLIRFEDIEIFEKAKPKTPRYTGPKSPSLAADKKKSPVPAHVKKKQAHLEEEDDDDDVVDDDDHDDEDDDFVDEEELPKPKKSKKKKPASTGKSGSKFIPRG